MTEPYRPPNWDRFIVTKPAKEVYDELIRRIRAEMKRRESIVFDPDTGIQKCFLDGKLLWVKKVR